MSDVLQSAAESLQNAAKQLTDLPAQMLAAQAQQRAQTAQQQAQQAAAQAAAAWQSAPLPLSQPGYVYGPPTAQQQAQQAAQQQRHYPPGGTPAWAQPAQTARQQAQQAAAQQQAWQQYPQQYPPGGVPAFNPQPPALTPQQQAQQQAAAQPSPGTLALAAARATPMQAQAASGMDRFRSGVEAATRGLRAFGAGLSVLEGWSLQLASKGSPTHLATYHGSQDLLMARLSGAVLPALEEASRTLQAIAHAIPRGAVQAVGEAGGGAVSNFRRGLAALGLVGEEKLKVSFAALPQPRYSSASEYGDRLSLAGLHTGELDGERIDEINRNLKDLIGELRVNRNPAPPGGGPPGGGFR